MNFFSRRSPSPVELVTIDTIARWPALYPDIAKDEHLDIANVNFPQQYPADDSLNNRVTLWQGNCTALQVDSIVNAANSSLLGGGGIDGVIHRAAGDELYEYCRGLGGCETGAAKITPGFNMEAKHIIHAVGPIYRRSMSDDDHELAALLASCYTTALDLAKENHCRCVSFPCISTGIYGYPNARAAVVALGAVRDWLTEHPDDMDLVIFNTFLDKDQVIYSKLLPKFFPIENEEGFLEQQKEQEMETEASNSTETTTEQGQGEEEETSSSSSTSTTTSSESETEKSSSNTE